NTVTYSGLSPTTNYSYTVSAIDQQGNESAQSAPVSTTTVACDATPPSTPVLTASAVSCNQVTLSWTTSTDPESGIKKYSVTRSDKGFSQDLMAPITTTFDASLNPSTTYTYTVTAVNKNDMYSAGSTAVSVTTPPCSAGIVKSAQRFGGSSG